MPTRRNPDKHGNIRAYAILHRDSNTILLSTVGLRRCNVVDAVLREFGPVCFQVRAFQLRKGYHAARKEAWAKLKAEVNLKIVPILVRNGVCSKKFSGQTSAS